MTPPAFRKIGGLPCWMICIGAVGVILFPQIASANFWSVLHMDAKELETVTDDQLCGTLACTGKSSSAMWAEIKRRRLVCEGVTYTCTSGDPSERAAGVSPPIRMSAANPSDNAMSSLSVNGGQATLPSLSFDVENIYTDAETGAVFGLRRQPPSLGLDPRLCGYGVVVPGLVIVRVPTNVRLAD